MRVGLVCPYSLDVPGGVQTQVLELAAQLRRRGHDAQVLAPGEGAAHPAYVTTTGRTVPVPWNGAVARLDLSRAAADATRDWLAAREFDVVHIHEPLAPGISLHALRAASAPVVATAHTAQERAWALRAGRAVVRRPEARIAAWTAVSAVAAETLARYSGRRPVLVPNGLDVAAFAEPRAARGAERTTALFLGRVDEPRKGLTTLLRAFAQVADERPGLRLLVAGPGDQRTALRELPDELAGRVQALGAVGPMEKVRLLAGAGVVVAPHLGGESFGIVVAEAMAAGAAVLASDLPAFRALLGNGRHGILVPPGDSSSLAQGLLELVDDPARRTALGESAARAARAYDWHTVTPQVLAVYAHVLDRPATIIGAAAPGRRLVGLETPARPTRRRVTQ